MISNLNIIQIVLKTKLIKKMKKAKRRELLGPLPLPPLHSQKGPAMVGDGQQVVGEVAEPPLVTGDPS